MCRNIIKREMVYRTKEEAEFYDQKRIYETQYKRYLLDNEVEPVNWEDEDQTKYCAYYHYEEQEIYVDNAYSCINQGTIYTTRMESIYEFAKQIGEDNFIKYILIGEYREE